MKAYAHALLWVPKSKVKDITEDFRIRLYQEKNCSKCEFRPDRHCDQCDECPNYMGEYRMWKEKERKGIKYIGLPMGRRKYLTSLIKKLGLSVEDQRSRAPMECQLKFLGTLRPEQIIAVEDMLKKKYGLLEAPPRSGKTVQGCYMSIKLGYKTIILANQHEYLMEFWNTFMGDKKTGTKPFTNAPELVSVGKHPIGFARKLEDFKKYDVCLSTYQTFLSEKGQLLLDEVCKMFGTLVIDECHKVPADRYTQVVSRFSALVRIGLSGTPERKDSKHILNEYILGPVTHKMEAQVMTPRVEIIETGVSTTYDYRIWAYAMRFLAQHEKRNEVIVRQVLKDLELGHSLVIPVYTVAHAQLLTNVINKVLPDDKPARLFYSGVPKPRRKEIIQEARNGEARVIVGIRSMLQLGINVPRWSCLYVVMPISNPPNFKQETSRVRTPLEKKQQPVVKFFLDDFGPSKGCFRTCWFQTVLPERFRFSQDTYQLAQKYLRKQRKGDTYDRKAVVNRI